MNMTQQYPTETPHNTTCQSMPDLTRLRFFHGQMLGANDLQTEQKYFQDKLKLHNRCLHGYGTVCGLRVVEVKNDPDCPPSAGQQAEHVPACVQIECGMAIDCEGNELVVQHAPKVDLWNALSQDDKDQIDRAEYGRGRLYLSICYCVQPIEPVRPVLPDACGSVSECVYSKLRDSVSVKVTLKNPQEHHCRNNCCDKCSDRCLLLAAIDFEKGKAVSEAHIYNDVRRWLSLYEAVTITSINWYHGALYPSTDARNLLQRDGLIINFSRPVLTETITDGVVDVWVIEGGLGRSGNIYNLGGRLVLPRDAAGNTLPTTTVLKFRQTTRESLQEGDRVLVILRADFILDECCRPVDGNHIGGRVPHIDGDHARPRLRNGQPIEQRHCLTMPQRYGPWVSGNRSAGDQFESWFYIKGEETQEYTAAAE
jgi:hypothetical protein